MTEFTAASLLGKLSNNVAKAGQYEHHVARLLIGRLGLSRQDTQDLYKGERPLNAFYDAWMGKQSSVFPFIVVPQVITAFNFTDIFTRPTRSVVVQTYKSVAEEFADDRPVAMVFAAHEIGQLVAVPYATSTVPALAVPPWCMVLHFDRWWNKLVGADRELD